MSFRMHDFYFFFSSRRRHTRSLCDWSSDVCSSDLPAQGGEGAPLTKQNRPAPFTKTLRLLDSPSIRRPTLCPCDWEPELGQHYRVRVKVLGRCAPLEARGL